MLFAYCGSNGFEQIFECVGGSRVALNAIGIGFGHGQFLTFSGCVACGRFASELEHVVKVATIHNADTLSGQRSLDIIVLVVITVICLESNVPRVGEQIFDVKVADKSIVVE